VGPPYCQDFLRFPHFGFDGVAGPSRARRISPSWCTCQPADVQQVPQAITFVLLKHNLFAPSTSVPPRHLTTGFFFFFSTRPWFAPSLLRWPRSSSVLVSLYGWPGRRVRNFHTVETTFEQDGRFKSTLPIRTIFSTAKMVGGPTPPSTARAVVECRPLTYIIRSAVVSSLITWIVFPGSLRRIPPIPQNGRICLMFFLKTLQFLFALGV